MISNKQGNLHTRQISHFPRLQSSSTIQYQSLNPQHKDSNKQNMNTTNYHDQQSKISEKSMRKVKMIKNVPMIQISKQRGSFYGFDSKLGENNQQLKSMTHTERYPVWNDNEIQQEEGQQTKRIFTHKNTRQAQSQKIIQILQSINRHDLINIYKSIKNLENITNQIDKLNSQSIIPYINTIDQAILQTFTQSSNQTSTQVQVQISTKKYDQPASADNSSMQKYESKLMEILQAVYRLKSTIEQLETSSSSLPKNQSPQPSQNINKKQNKPLKQQNLTKWRTQLQYLLSSIKSKHGLPSLHHIRQGQITLITHQKDKSMKSTDKNVPHYANSQSLDIKEQSVSIKPFQIDSQLHKECDCSEIQERSLGVGSGYRISEIPVVSNAKIQISQYNKIIGIYSIFKQVYKFMLELLYSHLKKLNPSRQNIIKKADQIYNNYRSLRVKNYENRTLENRIHELHMFMQQSVKGLKQLRKQCKKQLIL